MAISPARASTQTPARSPAHVPSPPGERGAWAVAIALGAIGVFALVAALSGLIGGRGASVPTASPPPVPLAAALPAPGAAVPAHAQRTSGLGVIVGRPSVAQQSADAQRFEAAPQALIAARWMEGFYP